MTEADRNARVEEIGAKLFQLDGSRGYSLSCLAHGQEALDDLEFVLKALKATQAELDRLKAELSVFTDSWDECAGEQGDTFAARFTDAVVKRLQGDTAGTFVGDQRRREIALVKFTLKMAPSGVSAYAGMTARDILEAFDRSHH